MAYQTSTNLYTNSKYIVSNVAGDSPFTTIQSAINAANAAGGNATVFIRQGAFTENLTLYSTVNLEGSESTSVRITGIHTPPNAGSVEFTRIGFISGTDVLNSAAAGTTAIKFTRCNFTVTNGYICNLVNWIGAIYMKYCNELSSTTNGIINNTGASQVDLINNTIGAGTAKSLTVNGVITVYNNRISCPIAISGSAVSVFDGGSSLLGTVTVTGNSSLTIANSRIATGAATALVASSTLSVLLSNVGINTSNAIAINGTGSVQFAEVTFPQSSVVAVTVTELLAGVVKTGENYSNTLLRMQMSGFVSWAAGGPYYDDTTLGSFTVLVGGTGYINNKLVTWTGPQTVAGMTAGNCYFVYIDATGTIGKTATRTDALFVNNIVLFECLRDSTPITNNQVTVKENHPYSYQVSVSNYLHDTVGAVIENATNGANITLVGTQGIGISGDDIYSDHGLDTTIPNSGGAAVTWRKWYTTAAGKWAVQNNTNTFTGYYNNAGTPTALTGGRFAVYRLYVSKDRLNTTTPTYKAVLHTAQFANLGSAQTAIANGTIAQATNELASLELAQLGYIIYRESTATIVEVDIAKTTLRSSTSTAGSSTAALVTTNITNFNNVLSSADTNVQTALETLDDFGSAAGNQTVNLYTGAGVKTVTLGSTNTTSTTTVQCGSGALNVTATGGALTVNSGVGALSISNDASATTVNIATGAAAKVVTLGSTNGASSLALKYGTADFTLASATGTTMSVLDTGEITMPLQSAFLAYNSTPRADVTGDGTVVTVIFDTEVFDQNADYDNGSHTFTAPITARYTFNYNIFFQAVAAAHTVVTSNLITSNANYYAFYQGGGNNIALGGNLVVVATFFVDMDAADTAYVTAAAYNGTKIIDINGAARGDAVTTFGGHLVC